MFKEAKEKYYDERTGTYIIHVSDDEIIMTSSLFDAGTILSQIEVIK